jgi:hypothetical protein
LSICKSIKGGKILNNSKFTDWGLKVKMELLSRGKEQKWLEEEVTKRTGLYLDSGYIYKILTGQRNAPKIVSAINEILEIKGD